MKAEIDAIARDLRDGIKLNAQDHAHILQDYDLQEGDDMPAMAYLEDILDVEWTCNQDKTFKSASILVACGGPTIWVDFGSNTVRGFGGGERAEAYFHDSELVSEIKESLENLFAC
jgi:hypothetical protein